MFLRFFQDRGNNQPVGQQLRSTRHLNFQDLAVDDLSNPTLLKVRLKYSKIDQLGNGVNTVLRRTYQDLCPVMAVMAYLAVRGDGEGPLFKFADGQSLTSRPVFRKHYQL